MNKLVMLNKIIVVANKLYKMRQTHHCLLLFFIFFLFSCESDHKNLGEDPNSPPGLLSSNEELNNILSNADNLLEQGKIDAAAAEYNTATEDFPKEPAAFVGRGRAFTIQEEYADAQTDFEYAIGLDDAYAPAYLERGIMWRDREEYEAAATDFDRALELDPNYSDVHVGRGVMYELQGDPAAAFKSYGQAIQINPDNIAAYRNRGALLFSVFFDDPSALADFNRALESDDKDVNTLLNRALYHIAQEDWAPAQADINLAFDLGTNTASAYTMRAYIGHKLGNSTGVIEDFDRAVQIDPDYWQGYQLRMFYHLENESWRSALNDAKRVVELEADEQAQAYAYYIQGLLYEKEFEDVIEAREAYLKAINIMPNDVSFNLALATLYNYYLEDVDNALVYYDRVIELDPSNAEAYFGRGVAYLHFEIPNDERPLSDFSQYLRLADDSDPQQAELAQMAIDELTVTFSDILLTTFVEGFFEGLFSPTQASNANDDQFFYVQRQYFNPRTGGVQDTYCSGCQDRSFVVESP